MQIAAISVFAALAGIAPYASTAVAGEPVPSHVDVIGITPAPGIGQPRDRIPANAQVIDAPGIRDGQSLSLPDFMARRLPSVTINEIQGNPLQPSVNYRGFLAAPLLGAPQGLSVYQDGVRINESFGDIVHWDLIPHNAIASAAILPGSNPLFGLNTLGGAISVRTKSGDTHPGSSIEVHGGSFGRRSIAAEHGRVSASSALFLAASRFRESGWRDRSPSDATQLFGKLGHRDARLNLDLALAHGETDLTGNGLVPASMHNLSRRQVFTVPDNTRNLMNMLTLNGAYWLGDDARVSATLYSRRNRTRTLNGDVNPGFEDDAALDGSNGANAGSGFNRDTGGNNRSQTVQRTSGISLQWSRTAGSHALAIGVSHDRGDSNFEQSAGIGVFDAARAVEEANPGSNVIRNRLNGLTRANSVFASEVYEVMPLLHVSVSARYNSARVAIRDLRVFSAPNLDGDHRYRMLNPALGFTWRVADPVTAYGGVSQGNRAPSPIELGCADRANPCTLPNAMASDPFLKQVVARTIEAGFRGRSEGNLAWNAGVYRTDSRDDILFVGTTTSSGYFTNFGRTRRQGVELGLGAAQARSNWNMQYSLLRATFESDACLLSPNNSSRGQSVHCAARGNNLIHVIPGNRLPGLPAHSLKLSGDMRLDERSSLGADLAGFSRQFARGNENNLHQAGLATAGSTTRDFQGSGSTPGYAVLNLTAKRQLAHGWEFLGRIDNLFDRRYTTGAALAENPFNNAGRFQTNSDNWTRETFVAPGAPRAVWIGLRYAFAGVRNP